MQDQTPPLYVPQFPHALSELGGLRNKRRMYTKKGPARFNWILSPLSRAFLNPGCPRHVVLQEPAEEGFHIGKGKGISHMSHL